ncbi:Heterogeneous nuclear ribonucleoprotein 1 [Dendrobium catenatum]|uniref:Heterogeneous nuclear ribonucleoprotein 1 n=1 Tax=Dendrobium catenatum TaxID=906689 RepID=A0A2I0X461_9ASPA|nr:Heterogeneous nuclear ribonucleoprotein 1 [Dendrobium catenatum]
MPGIMCASSPYLQERTCCITILLCFSSLGPRRKASLMEYEQGKVAAATNDTTVDNEGAPWNLLLEQHMRSLLNTLDRKELVDLHVKLAMTIPQAAEEIRFAAKPDPAHRKLFVYGFGEETTSETFCDAFSSSYGEIEEGRVVVDDATGKSRRFGFIIFRSLESVQKALEREGTVLDGRLAFHHPALEGFDGAIASAYVESRSLHVADISTDITTEMFLRFFEKYGEIEEGSVIYHKRTGKSRGFGFVTFKTSQAAMDAMADPEKNLGRNRISVNRARIRRIKGSPT